MPKVLIIATSHKTRGGITYVIHSHQRGKQWDDFHCKWIETHIDKGLHWKFIYALKAFFQYIIYLPSVQLIHIHVSEPPSALRKCMFMWWAKLWRKKTIVHFHSFSPETTIRSRWKYFYQYLFGQANIILVLSPYWKTEICKAFNLNDKVIILYNPCTSITNDMVYKKQPYILYAGALIARKGYADLIHAFAKISKQHPNWKLVFAGNGEIDKAKQLAQDCNIEKKVIFLGWINGKEKDKAFKEASVFCLPSYAEGFPMAVLDAWSYGLPVVSTPVGGLTDISINKQNILLFPPGDINKLSERLNRLISDESLRNNISTASKELSNHYFHEKVINQQLGELYKNIIECNEN